MPSQPVAEFKMGDASRDPRRCAGVNLKNGWTILETAPGWDVIFPFGRYRGLAASTFFGVRILAV